MELNQAFTCIGRGHGAPCQPATREEWEEMRRQKWLADMCERIERGDEELKHRLPVWTPHCAEFKGNHRAIGDALKPLNRLMLDFDEKGHTGDILSRLSEKGEELRMRGIEVLLVEESVRRGTHVLVELPTEMNADEAQTLMQEVTGFEPDKAVKDVARCIYMVPEDHTKFVSDKLWSQTHPQPLPVKEGSSQGTKHEIAEVSTPLPKREGKGESPQGPSFLGKERGDRLFKGIPYSSIIAEYWNRTGGVPVEGERNVRLHQLAVNLRAICDNKKEVLMQIMPRLGLSEEELRSIVESACKEPPKGISKQMKEILENEKMRNGEDEDDLSPTLSQGEGGKWSMVNGQWAMKKLPQGIRDSIEAVGPQLAMPVVTAICPAIGMLATGVTLDVHGKRKGLNLIAYIAGDFASGKGQIDPVVEAWTSEVAALDRMYQQQEDEWRRRKRAAKNKEEQPEEPKLPVRCLTLNNTVANLAERLANTGGKHAFSFTPEADTVAQKWKTAMSDFSVMLRQSYDGTKYEREARSAEAVNVHIDRLLWNVTMCGTPDALYRVVSNYTDGFQSRIAVARTPDNTFEPLEDKPHILNEQQTERIRQVAHLLPLMQGEVVLPKLEARGRKWLERIRLETMMNDDKVRARQRFRVCVTAQRMTCCLMLCKVAEPLIQEYGVNEAETQMKQKPDLWKEILLKTQKPTMLSVFDVLADSLLENALYFFRERIENAFKSRDYSGYLNGNRMKHGRNDSIYERLSPQFTLEQAMLQSVAVKGADVTLNSVRQMLKNWRQQGLIVQTDEGKYRKK